MAETRNVSGDKRPPRGPESAPSAKPRARKAAPGDGSGGGGASSGATPTPPEIKLSPSDAKLHASLVRFYSTVGMGVHTAGMARGSLALATAGVNIATTASETADAWLELAQQNKRVRTMLEGFVQGSAVATLAGSHIGMAVPIVLAVQGSDIGAHPMAAMMLSDEAKAFYTMHATPQSANGNHAAA